MTWVSRSHRCEADALGRLMYRSVRYGATAYSVHARAAWMPRRRTGRAWARRLSGQTVWVARRLTAPVGFISLRLDGYVDLAFVAPEALGQGVFSSLMRALLDAAGDRTLRTHASLHAQPAFTAHGFKVVRHEIKVARGQRLRRAEMIRPSGTRPPAV